MMRRICFTPATLMLLAGAAAAQSVPTPQPDESLKETFKQAKDAWANQGDRDGASAKFEQVLAALESRARSLDPAWAQVVGETYNWLAILEDRNPAKKAEAGKRLESLVAFNPDFELDRNITSAKLQALHEGLRSAKLAKVGFTYLPDGGVLKVDEVPGAASPARYLPFGAHKLNYSKPGFAPQEVELSLVPKDAKNVDFKLDRNASTLTLYTFPKGVDVLLDGKPLGRSAGQAPADMAPLAEKAGLKAEDLSGAFVVSELKVGKHILELKAPCFRPKRMELDESFTRPYADHVLEAIKLDPSRGTLTMSSAWPGGELFLSGQGYGPLPVNAISVCAGTYDLVVKYPAGGYSQRVEILEGKALSLTAKPKPRLAFLGLDHTEDFPGKARLLAQLQALGDRLKEVAYLKAKEGESPTEAMGRLRGAKEAELLLSLSVARDRPGTVVDVVLTTLEGEEERFAVKPLDEDPLADLVARLNTQPQIWESGAGVLVADLPGESGPVVLQVGDAGKAGLQALKPITQAGGKPVTRALAFRQALAEAKGESLAVTQAGVSINLPLNRDPLELPLQAPTLCYTFVLAELRLRTIAAKGDDVAFLKLNQGITLMHFRRYDRALELLREAKVGNSTRLGLGQGTVEYYTGICLGKLGSVYIPEAIQAFQQAQKYPTSTLFGPDGPLVAPLAKQAAEDLKN